MLGVFIGFSDVDKVSAKLLEVLFILDVILLVGDAKDLLFEVFSCLEEVGWLDLLALVLKELGCVEMVQFGGISVVLEVLLLSIVVLLTSPIGLLLGVLSCVEMLA